MKKMLFLMLLLSSVQTWCAEQSEEASGRPIERLGLLIEKSCPDDWEEAVIRVARERKVEDELVDQLTQSVHDLFVGRNANKLDYALKQARGILDDNEDFLRSSDAELKEALSTDADLASSAYGDGSTAHGAERLAELDKERASDALHCALGRKEVALLEELIKQDRNKTGFGCLLQ